MALCLSVDSSKGLIKSLIQSPYDALIANSCMTFEVASIRLTAEIGLPTILADSEDGLSIQEISEETGVDSFKLGPSSLLSYEGKELTCPLQSAFFVF